MSVLYDTLLSYDRESLRSLFAFLKLKDEEAPKDEKIGAILDELGKTAGIEPHLGNDALFMECLRITAKLLEIKDIDWKATDEESVLDRIYLQFQESAESAAEKIKDSRKKKIHGLVRSSIKDQLKYFELGGATLGTIAGGEAAGFGLYTGTAIGLKALGTIIGVTFPFGVYQTVMSILGVVIGPVGWIAGLAIFVFGGWKVMLRVKQSRASFVIMALILEYKARQEFQIQEGSQVPVDPRTMGVLTKLTFIDSDPSVIDAEFDDSHHD